MSTKDEALNMAIEVVESGCVHDSEKYWLMLDKLRTACKEALEPTVAELNEKTSQKPVAYYREWEDKYGKHKDIGFEETSGYSALYTLAQGFEAPTYTLDKDKLDRIYAILEEK